MKLIVNQEIEIGGQRYAKGQTAEAPEGLAAAFIAHGFARPAESAPIIETAEAPRAEVKTAALRGKKSAPAA